MRTISLSSLILVLILAGCNNIPGNTASGGAVSLTDSYSNAIPVPEQLIIGTFKLEETDLDVTPEMAAQLIPLWQAYSSLTASDSASQPELEALVIQIQETMNPDQIQAIADMKLTRDEMRTVMQAQGGIFGPAGSPGQSSGGTSVPGRQGGGFPGGGPPDGGMPGMGAPGGFGPGQAATPNPQAMATFQARRANTGASPGLINALIEFLQTKAG